MEAFVFVWDGTPSTFTEFDCGIKHLSLMDGHQEGYGVTTKDIKSIVKTMDMESTPLLMHLWNRLWGYGLPVQVEEAAVA